MKIMAIRETQYTKKFEADTEMEADSIVEGFKNNAIKEGYTVTKTKIDYKIKKGKEPREWYNVEVTMTYD